MHVQVQERRGRMGGHVLLGTWHSHIEESGEVVRSCMGARKA
jgi:hypothetical protein